MSLKALGLIEAIGLTTAIAAADAAAKSANVEILGYEKVNGGGRISVKLLGDVGAVKAALAAATIAGSQVGKIEATQLIARPHDEIEALIRTVDRGRPRKPVAQASLDKPKLDEAEGHPEANSEAISPEVASENKAPKTTKNETGGTGYPKGRK